MSVKELKKLQVIQQVADKRLKQVKAAEFLVLSLRQVKRLVKRFRKEGPRGLIHRLRGRFSNRRYPDRIRAHALQLYQNHYRGFGPTLASEKLLERHRIRMSRETLRGWLVEAGLWEKRKKGWIHRQWRQRRESFGEMVQMDGSHHDWLEGRGPELVLMGLIDDATNTVFARFYDYEGTLPAMDSFKRYLQRYGLPQSVYLDKHTTYRSWAKPTLEEDLEGRSPQSQFERALGELGVRVIHADSPQAKGRVERLFGILQDRLVKEMRLGGIKNKETANRFLQGFLLRYNRRFRREPKNPTDAHRPFTKEFNLKRILSIRKMRFLRNDNTIRHNKKLYLLPNHWSGRRPRRIETEERLDGKLYLLEKDRPLTYREIQEPPSVMPQPKSKPPFRKPPVPPPDHFWRKFQLSGTRFKQGFTPEFTIQQGDISNLHKR